MSVEKNVSLPQNKTLKYAMQGQQGITAQR
jgi:hypothetical protein